MKLAWATDTHLDCLKERPNDFAQFCEALKSDNPDGILLTGDISTSSNITMHLSMLERIVNRPVYYVLGNHDYYDSSIEEVRKQVSSLNNMSQFLRYLPVTPYVSLTKTSALVGHDGWYDGGYGDIKQSTMVMNDWLRISDYVNSDVIDQQVIYSGVSPSYGRIASLSKRLAHTSVLHVQAGIKAAVRYHKVILIATHFPPFEEACQYNGGKSEVGALPWYSSKMMGDLLRQAATAFPNIRFEVFAGHTHSKCDVQIAKNLFCHIGSSEYYHPIVQSTIEVP